MHQFVLILSGCPTQYRQCICRGKWQIVSFFRKIQKFSWGRAYLESRLFSSFRRLNAGFCNFAAFTCGTEDLTELPIDNWNGAGFHSCKGPGCRVPGLQGSKVPRIQGSRVVGFQDSRVERFQDYMVPRFQGCNLPDTTPRPTDWNPTESLLRISCVYIENCISKFLMCKHFGPLKPNLNAALSGHHIA